MKGMVFTDFLKFVESRFGYALVDEMLQETTLASGGIYTAVGSYHHDEFFALCATLSAKTNIKTSELLREYGKYYFPLLYESHNYLLNHLKDVFDLFESIDRYIHVEVHKLYPGVELPTFHCERPSANELRLVYTSERKMADFAEGLLVSACDMFRTKVAIKRKNLQSDGSVVQFSIHKLA
jgi:hypothetical protein